MLSYPLKPSRFKETQDKVKSQRYLSNGYISIMISTITAFCLFLWLWLKNKKIMDYFSVQDLINIWEKNIQAAHYEQYLLQLADALVGYKIYFHQYGRDAYFKSIMSYSFQSWNPIWRKNRYSQFPLSLPILQQRLGYILSINRSRRLVFPR